MESQGANTMRKLSAAVWMLGVASLAFFAPQQLKAG
jgi:hypothetical protein